MRPGVVGTDEHQLWGHEAAVARHEQLRSELANETSGWIRAFRGHDSLYRYPGHATRADAGDGQNADEVFKSAK